MASMQPTSRSTGRARVPGVVPPPSRPLRTGVAGPDYAPGGGGPGRPGGPGGPGGGRGPDDPRYRRSRPRPRWGRIVVVAAALLLVLAGVASAGGWLYYRSVDAGLSRDDPFAQITGGRPARLVNGAQNILMLGSDSRDPAN